MGELRELDNHLNSDPPADKTLEGCPWTVLSCPLCRSESETKLSRKDIKAHLSENHDVLDLLLDLSQLQTYKLEIQSLVSKLGEVEREKIDLKRRVAELEEKLTCHDSKHDVALSYSEQLPLGPGEIFLTNFELRRKTDEAWYSPPFYSHPHGYKMCLEVHCKGKNAGRGSHVSVFVNLVQGEFDEQLKWPFCGKVSIHLLNQESGKRHCTKTVHFRDRTPSTSAGIGCRVTEVGVTGRSGLGFPKFVAYSDLGPKLLRNDCLRFCVSEIKLKL